MAIDTYCGSSPQHPLRHPVRRPVQPAFGEPNRIVHFIAENPDNQRQSKSPAEHGAGEAAEIRLLHLDEIEAPAAQLSGARAYRREQELAPMRHRTRNDTDMRIKIDGRGRSICRRLDHMHQSRRNPGRIYELTLLRFRTLIKRKEIPVEADIQDREISVGHV